MYFLGAVTGSSGSCSNAWTGPSGGLASGVGFFTIPQGVRAVYLQPSASGVQFEIGTATGISFQTTLARSAQLQDAKLSGPFRVGRTDYPSVVAIYNNTGGTVSCKIYADDGET